jgi:hypothetical protein
MYCANNTLLAESPAFTRFTLHGHPTGPTLTCAYRGLEAVHLCTFSTSLSLTRVEIAGGNPPPTEMTHGTSRFLAKKTAKRCLGPQGLALNSDEDLIST